MPPSPTPTNFTYVYLLRSSRVPTAFYIGLTTDLQARLAKHNELGNPPTAALAPWSIKTAIAFDDAAKAGAFERYLKTSSGRSFAKKHL